MLVRKPCLPELFSGPLEWKQVVRCLPGLSPFESGLGGPEDSSGLRLKGRHRSRREIFLADTRTLVEHGEHRMGFVTQLNFFQILVQLNLAMTKIQAPIQQRSVSHDGKGVCLLVSVPFNRSYPYFKAGQQDRSPLRFDSSPHAYKGAFELPSLTLPRY